MRHAQSYYNNLSTNYFELSDVLKKGNTPNFKYSHSDLINDSNLTEKGLLQCFNHKDNDTFKDIKYVFISPLCRCWETFFNSFNSFDNIKKVVILPDIREWLSSQNDIPIKLNEFISKKEIKNKLDFTFMSNTDFLNNPLWIFKSPINKQIQYNIDTIMSSEGVNNHDKLVKILDIMKVLWPNRLESYSNFKERVYKSLIEMNSYLVINELETNNIIKNDEVLIITHYEVIKLLTKNRVENCDYVSYNLT